MSIYFIQLDYSQNSLSYCGQLYDQPFQYLLSFSFKYCNKREKRFLLMLICGLKTKGNSESQATSRNLKVASKLGLSCFLRCIQSPMAFKELILAVKQFNRIFYRTFRSVPDIWVVDRPVIPDQPGCSRSLYIPQTMQGIAT